MFNTISKYYAVGAMAYGTARKAIQVRNAHYDTYDRDKGDVKIPMLMSEKIVLSTLSGLMAPYALPVYLFLDMSMIEAVYIRKNPDLYCYGTKKKLSILDYMFC